MSNPHQSFAGPRADPSRPDHGRGRGRGRDHYGGGGGYGRGGRGGQFADRGEGGYGRGRGGRGQDDSSHFDGHSSGRGRGTAAGNDSSSPAPGGRGRGGREFADDPPVDVQALLATELPADPFHRAAPHDASVFTIEDCFPWAPGTFALQSARDLTLASYSTLHLRTVDYPPSSAFCTKLKSEPCKFLFCGVYPNTQTMFTDAGVDARSLPIKRLVHHLDFGGIWDPKLPQIVRIGGADPRLLMVIIERIVECSLEQPYDQTVEYTRSFFCLLQDTTLLPGANMTAPRSAPRFLECLTALSRHFKIELASTKPLPPPDRLKAFMKHVACHIHLCTLVLCARVLQPGSDSNEETILLPAEISAAFPPLRKGRPASRWLSIPAELVTLLSEVHPHFAVQLRPLVDGGDDRAASAASADFANGLDAFAMLKKSTTASSSRRVTAALTALIFGLFGEEVAKMVGGTATRLPAPDDPKLQELQLTFAKLLEQVVRSTASASEEGSPLLEALLGCTVVQHRRGLVRGTLLASRIVSTLQHLSGRPALHLHPELAVCSCYPARRWWAAWKDSKGCICVCEAAEAAARDVVSLFAPELAPPQPPQPETQSVGTDDDYAYDTQDGGSASEFVDEPPASESGGELTDPDFKDEAPDEQSSLPEISDETFNRECLRIVPNASDFLTAHRSFSFMSPVIRHAIKAVKVLHCPTPQKRREVAEDAILQSFSRMMKATRYIRMVDGCSEFAWLAGFRIRAASRYGTSLCVSISQSRRAVHWSGEYLSAFGFHVLKKGTVSVASLLRSARVTSAPKGTPFRDAKRAEDVLRAAAKAAPAYKMITHPHHLFSTQYPEEPTFAVVLRPLPALFAPANLPPTYTGPKPVPIAKSPILDSCAILAFICVPTPVADAAILAHPVPGRATLIHSNDQGTFSPTSRVDYKCSTPDLCHLPHALPEVQITIAYASVVSALGLPSHPGTICLPDDRVVVLKQFGDTSVRSVLDHSLSLTMRQVDHDVHVMAIGHLFGPSYTGNILALRQREMEGIRPGMAQGILAIPCWAPQQDSCTLSPLLAAYFVLRTIVLQPLSSLSATAPVYYRRSEVCNVLMTDPDLSPLYRDLDPYQLAGVFSAFTNPVTYIIGPPGNGKSHVGARIITGFAKIIRSLRLASSLSQLAQLDISSQNILKALTKCTPSEKSLLLTRLNEINARKAALRSSLSGAQSLSDTDPMNSAASGPLMVCAVKNQVLDKLLVDVLHLDSNVKLVRMGMRTKVEELQPRLLSVLQREAKLGSRTYALKNLLGDGRRRRQDSFDSFVEEQEETNLVEDLREFDTNFVAAYQDVTRGLGSVSYIHTDDCLASSTTIATLMVDQTLLQKAPKFMQACCSIYETTSRPRPPKLVALFRFLNSRAGSQGPPLTDYTLPELAKRLLNGERVATSSVNSLRLGETIRDVLYTPEKSEAETDKPTDTQGQGDETDISLAENISELKRMEMAAEVRGPQNFLFEQLLANTAFVLPSPEELFTLALGVKLPAVTEPPSARGSDDHDERDDSEDDDEGLNNGGSQSLLEAARAKLESFIQAFAPTVELKFQSPVIPPREELWTCAGGRGRGRGRNAPAPVPPRPPAPGSPEMTTLHGQITTLAMLLQLVRLHAFIDLLIERGRLVERIESTLKQFNEIRTKSRSEVVDRCDVVGATASGLGLAYDAITILQPSVLVCEEAAEALPSELIPSLRPTISHVIQLGDHHQLGPGSGRSMLQRAGNLTGSIFKARAMESYDESGANQDPNDESLDLGVVPPQTTTADPALLLEDMCKRRTAVIQLCCQRRTTAALSCLWRGDYSTTIRSAGAWVAAESDLGSVTRSVLDFPTVMTSFQASFRSAMIARRTFSAKQESVVRVETVRLWIQGAVEEQSSRRNQMTGGGASAAAASGEESTAATPGMTATTGKPTVILNDEFAAAAAAAATAALTTAMVTSEVCENSPPGIFISHQCPETDSSSPTNIQEVRAAIILLQHWIESGVDPRHIAVLCFYKGLVREFRNQIVGSLAFSNELKQINSGTLDSFQGSESPVCVVLTGRTCKATEYLRSRQRMVVLLSRQQGFIVVFGNARLLATAQGAEYWRPRLRLFAQWGGLLHGVIHLSCFRHCGRVVKTLVMHEEKGTDHRTYKHECLIEFANCSRTPKHTCHLRCHLGEHEECKRPCGLALQCGVGLPNAAEHICTQPCGVHTTSPELPHVCRAMVSAVCARDPSHKPRKHVCGTEPPVCVQLSVKTRSGCGHVLEEIRCDVSVDTPSFCCTTCSELASVARTRLIAEGKARLDEQIRQVLAGDVKKWEVDEKGRALLIDTEPKELPYRETGEVRDVFTSGGVDGSAVEDWTMVGGDGQYTAMSSAEAWMAADPVRSLGFGSTLMRHEVGLVILHRDATRNDCVMAAQFIYDSTKARAFKKQWHPMLRPATDLSFTRTRKSLLDEFLPVVTSIGPSGAPCARPLSTLPWNSLFQRKKTQVTCETLKEQFPIWEGNGCFALLVGFFACQDSESLDAAIGTHKTDVIRVETNGTKVVLVREPKLWVMGFGRVVFNAVQQARASPSICLSRVQLLEHALVRIPRTWWRIAASADELRPKLQACSMQDLAGRMSSTGDSLSVLGDAIPKAAPSQNRSVTEVECYAQVTAPEGWSLIPLDRPVEVFRAPRNGCIRFTAKLLYAAGESLWLPPYSFIVRLNAATSISFSMLSPTDIDSRILIGLDGDISRTARELFTPLIPEKPEVLVRSRSHCADQAALMLAAGEFLTFRQNAAVLNKGRDLNGARTGSPRIQGVFLFHHDQLHRLYSAYVQSGCRPCEPTPPPTHDAAVRFAHRVGIPPPDYEGKAEGFFFHGVRDTKNVLSILQSGLDFRRGQGMLGQSLYLADDSAKSDQYLPGGVGVMLIVRASLGPRALKVDNNSEVQRSAVFPNHPQFGEEASCVIWGGNRYSEYALRNQNAAIVEAIMVINR